MAKLTGKRVDIEELLRWTYRDELPRLDDRPSVFAAIRNGWAGVERYGELLTLVDVPTNAYGAVIDLDATRGPDAAALVVADAVQALNDLDFVIPSDWNPIEDFGDLGPLGPEAVTEALDLMGLTNDSRQARRPMAALMMRQAIMGGAPDWRGDMPSIEVVSDGGKPLWFRKVFIPLAAGGDYEVEVDGRDPVARKPYRDAYRKFYLEPSPREAIIGRAEYELWCAALDMLSDELNKRLPDHAIMPHNRPARPWMQPQAQRRILEDVSLQSAR